jgi:hypothetical protein
MLEKHYELVILGAGEIAKAILANSKGKKTLIISRKTEKITKNFDVEGLDWDGSKDEMPSNITANVVVNCILPSSKQVAYAGVNLARIITKNDGVYIHLSTIALFSRPRRFPRLIKFIGDGYIRIKRAELNYVSKICPKARIVVPGIVIGGNTGWDKFLERTKSAKTITIGTNLTNRAPVVELGELANKIENIISNGFDGVRVFVPLPDKSDLPKWEDLISNKDKIIVEKSYDFFPDIIRNTITLLLTSNFVPDIVWDRFLLSNLKSKSDVVDNNAEIQQYSISGMTNFYIGSIYQNIFPDD